MDKKRWSKIREIFSHLCDQSPSFRSNYLDIVCETDPQLRRQIENMLVAHDEVDTHESFQTSFNEEPLPESIGEYRIDSELGRGGMGIVYRASHSLYGSVALKVLPARYLEHATARKRFEQEASLIEKIDHPIVCRIFETGLLEDCAFIAMEEICGTTLREELKERALSYSESIRIARELADGLFAAHNIGVVHRDIKPSNVIIDSRNAPHLIDFGIAKLADTHLTATGELLGSPAYMSPEQWRGKRVNNKTDIWSLGILLFEMISGEAPFAGDTVGAIAKRVLSHDSIEMPSHSNDGYELSEARILIMHMLEQDPDERPVSMETVSHSLTRLYDGLKRI